MKFSGPVISKTYKLNQAYPFGMVMLGREYAAEEYKFGFNGKPKDIETNTYDYGFRVYNSRLGKFLSVDPLTMNYPWYTPYQFAGNKVIQAIDLDGLEEFEVVTWYDRKENQFRTCISVINASGPLIVIYKVRVILNQKLDENVDLIDDPRSSSYNPSRFRDKVLETRHASDYDVENEVWKDPKYKTVAENRLAAKKKNQFTWREWFNDGKNKNKFLTVHVWKDKWSPKAWLMNPVEADRDRFLMEKDDDILFQTLRDAISLSKVPLKNEIFVWVTNEADKISFEKRYSDLGFKSLKVTVVKVDEDFERGDGKNGNISSEGGAYIYGKVSKPENRKVKL